MKKTTYKRTTTTTKNDNKNKKISQIANMIREFSYFSFFPLLTIKEKIVEIELSFSMQFKSD